jgi:hypothetical protein
MRDALRFLLRRDPPVVDTVSQLPQMLTVRSEVALEHVHRPLPQLPDGSDAHCTVDAVFSGDVIGRRHHASSFGRTADRIDLGRPPTQGTMSESSGGEIMAKKPKKTWVDAPKKSPTEGVPVDLKAAVTTETGEFIEKVLKPKCVQPPPKEPRFNYVIDVWSKWHRNYFYLGATYASPGPYAMSPTFETKFARMEYIGGKRFALAYMRHTERWFTVYPSLTLAKCLEVIEGNELFQP